MAEAQHSKQRKGGQNQDQGKYRFPEIFHHSNIRPLVKAVDQVNARGAEVAEPGANHRLRNKFL